jgi:hypothetical protein
MNVSAFAFDVIISVLQTAETTIISYFLKLVYPFFFFPSPEVCRNNGEFATFLADEKGLHHRLWFDFTSRCWSYVS